MNSCRLFSTSPSCSLKIILTNQLGATSNAKIREVRLSDEIGVEGFETLKKTNFIITIRYEILTFSSVGPFFEEGGRGSRKFRPEAEIFWDFFN